MASRKCFRDYAWPSIRHEKPICRRSWTGKTPQRDVAGKKKKEQCRLNKSLSAGNGGLNLAPFVSFSSTRFSSVGNSDGCSILFSGWKFSEDNLSCTYSCQELIGNNIRVALSTLRHQRMRPIVPNPTVPNRPMQTGVRRDRGYKVQVGTRPTEWDCSRIVDLQ